MLSLCIMRYMMSIYVTVHVGGRFEMKPILDYVGGMTVDFDWILPKDLDLRVIDKMALCV
ncbi:hypothetical protein Leryth_002617, partial [Lithospermum erythrorhizon]